MNRLLHIDTAGERASVCLTLGDSVLDVAENPRPQDHAAWLHVAIQSLLQKQHGRPGDLEAVSVTIGPGSYTGLRVGLAAAKGLCFALTRPLITVSTLEVMAHSVRAEATDLIIPMIDARRMEVFTAAYDKDLCEVITPRSMILDRDSFSEELKTRHLLFCGSGAVKFRELTHNPRASFSNSQHNAGHLAILALQRFYRKEFADLAYTEPLYLKEFQGTLPRSS